MISQKTLQILKKEQEKLDELIYQQRNVDLEWNSLVNAKRLKLNILVEIGEFANELKTFKLWRNKKETDLAKAKEELIDCLCFFLGLCNIYKIDFSYCNFVIRKELDFNDLLLNFFFQANNLYIEEREACYSESIEISEVKLFTYYKWLQTFTELSLKLGMNETEVIKVYSEKNKVNQQRVIRGY